MTKIVCEEWAKFYFHNPSLAAIVTVHAKGKDNALAVAWHGALSFSPPLYGVAVSTKRFSHEAILEAGEFGVNFLPFEAIELIASVGGTTGEEIDKFKEFHIETEKPAKISAPILKQAYAAYECQVVDHKLYGDHIWFVGQVVAVHLDEALFTDKETLDLTKVNPALYLGADHYATTSPESLRFISRSR